MVDEIANIKKKFVFQFFYIKLFFYFDRSRKFYSEEEQFYRTNPKMIAKEATIAEGGTILGKLGLFNANKLLRNISRIWKIKNERKLKINFAPY